MNSGILSGNLAADPEARGSAVRVRIAVDMWNPSTKTREAQFIPAVAFGKTGEVLMKYAQKGRHVDVRYHLSPNSWTDSSGNKRWELQVIVDELDLGPGGKGAAAPAPSGGYDPDDDGPSGFSF